MAAIGLGYGLIFDTGNLAVDPTDIVVTSGSYNNPTWLTSLAYSKITGGPDDTFVVGSEAAMLALSATGDCSVA